MAARAKKKYYMTFGTDGKEQIYQTPDRLLAKAYEYFAWCESNPCNKTEMMKSGDRKGDVIDIPIGRPFTIVGLCVFCGISESTLKKYESDNDFKIVISHLRDIIRQEQLEGAALGRYNATVVSRLLGLADQQEVDGMSPSSINISTTDPSTVEQIEILKKKLSD